MPVKSNVVFNTKKLFKEIQEEKAAQFVYTVLSIGAANSRLFTPIEYGLLINSQKQEVQFDKNGVYGVLSYGGGVGTGKNGQSVQIDYAVYLNGNKNYTPFWNPRPPNKKDGNAWNSQATPRFLEKGFETDIAKQEIQDAIDIFKI